MAVEKPLETTAEMPVETPVETPAEKPVEKRKVVEKKLVLVVEDEQDVRMLVALLLTEEGYEVETAADGQAALEAVARQLPHVILLDMRMPRMDGWQFARLFRERYDSLRPIIVMTASPDARVRAAEIGADDFVGKPFRLDELIAVVRRWV